MSGRDLAALRLLGRLTQLQAAAERWLRVRRTSAVLEPSAWTSVLVVRLDETIGDTVMFSPFLRELRRSLPAARITLVVNEARIDMYEQCPYVDDVVATTLRCAATRSVFARPFNARAFVKRALGGRQFDVAFVPRVDYDHNAAFIASASRAQLRLGFSVASTARKSVVNRGLDRLFTRVLVATPHRHESDRALDLLRAAGLSVTDSQPELWVPDAAHAAAEEFLRARAIGDFVVVAPTGGHSDLKQWPTSRYDDVARAFLDEGRAVVVVGGPPDLSLLDDFSPDVRDRLHVAIGELRVVEAVALLTRASGFVGADSGMSHVAAAAGIPTVAVFGPTCTHAFSPRGPLAETMTLSLPCSPCERDDAGDIDRCATCIFDETRCMIGISSAQVLNRTGTWPQE